MNVNEDTFSKLTEPATHPGLADRELLRRYEPIVCYTKGEEFFPTNVESYLKLSSLWVHYPDGRDELLIEQGGVSLETLTEPRRAEFGAVHYLKFIEPLNIAELTAFLVTTGVKRRRDQTNVFRTDLGRLARVGYGSRLLAALFSLTLLLRGRVPGDTAAAAVLTGRQIRAIDDTPVYYGRVVRENGWIALQYWFFYYFNNWRSGFHGANDHEGDWEMITVYLDERPDGAVAPAWVAYASHDFHGDDLRRRWDDRAELTRIGDHPVVFAGAGSHASYFRPGEYLTEIEIPHLTPLIRLADRVRAFWVQTLRQAGAEVGTAHFNIFRIPFVDYARGDGLRIGPGGEREWVPVVLNPVPGWVSGYRGLWGLYARDPLSGENAPSGPMYNRDGSVRGSWDDPVGWAGLDKVPTPTMEVEILDRRQAALAARQRELDLEITTKSEQIHEIGVEIAALQGNPHLKDRHASLLAELRALATQVQLCRQERAQGEALLEALARRLARLAAGEPGDPRAHISRLARPTSDARLRLSRWVELWAAISISTLLIGLVILLVAARQYVVDGLAVMLGSFIFIEAVFRRQLVGLISTVTIGLAIVASGVLLYKYFWQILVIAILAAGLYLLWENLRELRG